MITLRIREALAFAFMIDKARDAILWTCDKNGNFTQRELSKADTDQLRELYEASITIQREIRLGSLFSCNRGWLVARFLLAD